MSTVTGRRLLVGDLASFRLAGKRWVLPAFFALLVGVMTIATPLWQAGQAGLWGELDLASVSWRAAFAMAGANVVLGVLLSRRSPAWATALAMWPFLAIPVTGTFIWAWWMGLLAIATCAAVDGWRRCLMPFAVTLLVALVYVWSGVPALLPIGPVFATSSYHSGDTWITTSLYMLASAAAVGLAAAAGSAGRSRRVRVEAAQASQHALAVESVATERARLARDLHDVVAHHVSLVAVRAESAPYMHPELGEAARGVLADIAGNARSALEELRQVLSVLQRTEESPVLAPHPGIENVAELVEDATAAGQPVAFTQGTLSSVPTTQGYVLYRIVQEALTNARRHAPGSPVDVEVTEHSGQVTVRVANPLPANTTDPVVPGRGLIGMRERVEALGGTLEAGYRPRSFLVVATLPLTGVGTES